MKYDNNFLCYNSCLYRYINSGNIIFILNIYDIIKNYLLNYFIILKYQTLILN